MKKNAESLTEGIGFRFQLTKEEHAVLMSQIVMSNFIFFGLLTCGGR